MKESVRLFDLDERECERNKRFFFVQKEMKN